MNQTILVLDDDAKRISSHVELLQDEGYPVIIEYDTAKMVPRFQQDKDKIALIVLDMMMPPGNYTREETDYARKTGIAVLKDIRNISKDVLVIVLSVLGDNGLRKEATSLGISEYLEKPIRPSELIRVIRKTLSR